MDLACIKSSVPAPKRPPPSFEATAHFLRSATSSGQGPSEDDVQAAVHEGAEQLALLASGNEAVVRKGGELDECYKEMEEEVCLCTDVLLLQLCNDIASFVLICIVST